MLRKHSVLVVLLVAAFGAGFLVGRERPVMAQTKNRLFEVRIATATDRESRDHTVNRFRGEELGLMQKAGMQPIGLWVPVNDPPDINPHQRTKRVADRTFIYVLAHESKRSAEETWTKFRADPAFKSIGQRWPRHPGSAPAGPTEVEEIFMEPVDFSPIK